MFSAGGQSGGATAELADKFKTYLALETSWWVAVYAVCYRFQPTVAVMRTEWGVAAVRGAGAWLERVWPTRYHSIAGAAQRVYASQNGRTVSEWLLVNKVLSPVSFPVKLALANRIVNQRAALAGAAGATLAAAQSVTSEPLGVACELQAATTDCIGARQAPDRMLPGITDQDAC